MEKTNLSYLNRAITLLMEVRNDEAETLHRASELMTTTILNGNSLFIFGASHAGILAEEAYFRAGGLVVMNPIFAKGLFLDNSPITITSAMERLEGYGTIIVNKSAIKSGDCLIVHSVSGRNPVTIEVALQAKTLGARVIAITNLKYSYAVTSRYSKGLKLFEVADVVIDNHGDIGDAAIPVGVSAVRVGATSTVVGAAILNELVVETAQRLEASGETILPVFFSANLDDGEGKNRSVVEKYRNQMHYDFE